MERVQWNYGGIEGSCESSICERKLQEHKESHRGFERSVLDILRTD